MNTRYRNLTEGEIEQLERAGNYAEDWSAIHVTDLFCVECLRNNYFDGEVRLGAVENAKTADGDLTLREGIYNSTLSNVTVGDHPTIHNVRMLSNYTLGDNVLLFNIEEMTCTSDPHDIGWLEPMNENGGRRLLPYGDMRIGDAYLWARYRGRKKFLEKLEQFTYDVLATDEGRYGRVGDYCVIKNTKTLHNVIVNSSFFDKTRIDGCIVLSDGVVSSGCTLEYGVIAVRFLLGEHVHLEFGLRLNDTVVGDNSTLARCEVGNSIIFPAHEQHHNNSFLIAGLIMGQSNIAAGGTIGSNHNSRTADNEIAAGRGFWPGLCCSFKHSSRFASYCLLAKGDYPAELDITLPFALVNNNTAKDQLEVMPAYWWMYNMYAMDRNSKKFAKRDKRVVKSQHIEFDNLAPDTAEEILHGMELLRGWMANAKDGVVLADGMEKGKRKTVILKAAEGLKAYEEMLVFYAMKTLDAEYGQTLPPDSLAGKRVTEWVNIGGQLIQKVNIETLINEVERGIINSWDKLHTRLSSFWGDYYKECKCKHAYAILCELAGADKLDEALWQRYLQRYADIRAYIEEQKIASRHKDDINPFRNMTYWDDAERDAVL
ncbi:MAG: DUF4954 family protein [Bacteroidales bacterium]|nr:DUF4954 family protein [Bacteroidales bacterium]